jgi:hypothetical protein
MLLSPLRSKPKSCWYVTASQYIPDAEWRAALLASQVRRLLPSLMWRSASHGILLAKVIALVGVSPLNPIISCLRACLSPLILSLLSPPRNIFTELSFSCCIYPHTSRGVPPRPPSHHCTRSANMRYSLVLLALAAAIEASPFPQGVTAKISPPGKAPPGCQPTYAAGTFGIAVMNISTAAKGKRQVSTISE